MFFCHHFIDTFFQFAFKTKVTIGYYTDKIVLIINNRNSANMKFGHQAKCILHCRTALDGYGIVDHTVFCTFNDGYLAGLFLDGHVLMNYTDTPFACNGDSHFRFGNRVHSSGYERYFQLDVT